MTQTHFKPSRADLLPILFLVGVVMLWFYPFFLRGDVLLPPNATSTYPWYGTAAYSPPHPQGSMDAVRENYITWALHHTYLREGYAPYWNPYFLNGNSLVANQFAIPYSPFKLLNYLFSAGAAWSWAIILKSFINGLFTYLSLRALSRGRTASLIGALAWMLSWPLAHQTQTTYSEGVALLPLVFFFSLLSYQASQRRAQIIYGALAALGAGAQFLVGNIQMTIYCFALLLAFALYWSWDQQPKTGGILSRLRPLTTLILIYGAGVIVGAVGLWPTYELLNLSIRGASQTHQNKGIEPYTSLSFLNPWLYYWRNFEFPDLRARYWLTFRWNPYIGLWPLVANALALRFVRDRVARALLIFTLTAFGLLHLLYWRPLFEIVSQIPGYDALEHARLLIVLPFPMALLAGYGTDWLLDYGRARWRALRPILLLAALSIPLMIGLLLAAMRYFEGELSSAANLADGFFNQRTQIGTQLIADYYHLQNQLFLLSIFGMGFILILAAVYASGRLSRRYFEPLLIGFVAAEMLIFAGVNVGSSPAEKLYPTTPAIEFLQNEMQRGQPFRISTAPNTLSEGRETGLYSSYQADHGWFLSSAMPFFVPNTPALFGLHDIRAYESVYTMAYSQYLARADGRPNLFSAGVWPAQAIRNPMIDALNVRYIMAVEPLDDPALNLVYSAEVLIYENLNALPRVKLYDRLATFPDENALLDALAAPDYDPAAALYFIESELDFTLSAADTQNGTAHITLYEPNRVRIQTQNPTDSLLLLSDLAYPGWRAYVDGENAPIYTANHIMRAVYLPAGAHEVEFRYESKVVRASLWLTYGGAFGLIVLILALSLPPRRQHV